MTAGPRLDWAGWFLATAHQLMGHDATAAFIGQPIGDKTVCVLCVYERHPSDTTRRAVLNAIGVRE